MRAVSEPRRADINRTSRGFSWILDLGFNSLAATLVVLSRMHPGFLISSRKSLIDDLLLQRTWKQNEVFADKNGMASFVR